TTDVHSLKADTLISLHQINANLEDGLRLKRFPQITFLNNKLAYYKDGGKYFKLEKEKTGWTYKFWMELAEDAENVNFIPGKNASVYTVKNNLFYQTAEKTVQITNDADENIINGQSVHRQEFGIDRGIFLPPNNDKLSFYRMDQTMVTDY